MTDENLVKKISAFGLPYNQARVYAFLCEAETATVPVISGATHIHVQDVYKTLEALQSKGLVLREGGTPIRFEAVPISEGLDQCIKTIENESTKKIYQLRSYLKEIASEVKRANLETEHPKVAVFSVWVPKSKLESSFDSIEDEFKQVIPDLALGFYGLSENRIQFKKLAKRNIAIRILILNKKSESRLFDELKSILPRNGNFEIRTLNSEENFWFVMFDSKEIWIPILSVGENTLVTNAAEIVRIGNSQFEALWNNPDTRIELKSVPNAKKR